MGITDKAAKSIGNVAKKAQETVKERKDEIVDVLTSAECLIAHTVAHRVIVEKSKQIASNAAKAVLTPALKLGGLATRWSLMESLAGAIDRLLEHAEAEELLEEAVEETVEEAVEETTVEETPVEEPAVQAYAAVETPVSSDDNDNDDDDDDDDESYDGIDMSDLEFIDVMEQPEVYATYLEQEKAGEVRLVNRYRRSFRSRLVQSQGNVQEYYSILKNALLSYKGVKDRTSWDYESFNKGRVKVAKINAKKKSLYLYLALDPATLVDTKYFFDDVSSKKKYAAVPVLFKIKGERKLKHALELIEKLCGEQLALPPVKDFEAVDYTVPHKDTKTLVQEGLIKQLTATVPVEVSTEEINFF